MFSTCAASGSIRDFSQGGIDIYLVRHGGTWYSMDIPAYPDLNNIPTELNDLPEEILINGFKANTYIQGGNADGKLQKLSPEGRKQAVNVGRFLKEHFPDLSRIYTSCLKRGVETAKLAAAAFGLPIEASGPSDAEIALEEACIIRKEDLAEIRHGRNDGKTEAKVRTALYKDLFDQLRITHPMDDPLYDPYWKWKIVPNQKGAGGSFDDAETPWKLLYRAINVLVEICDDHVKNPELGRDVVAVTSSAFIQSLKVSAIWQKYLKDCAQTGTESSPEELSVFFEKGLAKNCGIFHFRYHPEEQNLLNKIEFIEDISTEK